MARKVYFLFHAVISGCAANNEVDWSKHNLAHPARFGDRGIFLELFHVAPEQQRFPHDRPPARKGFKLRARAQTQASAE